MQSAQPHPEKAPTAPPAPGTHLQGDQVTCNQRPPKKDSKAQEIKEGIKGGIETAATKVELGCEKVKEKIHDSRCNDPKDATHPQQHQQHIVPPKDTGNTGF
jgi:hypothetical protein